MFPTARHAGPKPHTEILGIGCAGALATIGTWIAIGSGPRAFSLSAPFAEMQTAGEAIGRTVFGLGAVVVWIYAIALSVGTMRKFFGTPPSPSIVPSDPAEPLSRSATPAEKEPVPTAHPPRKSFDHLP